MTLQSFSDGRPLFVVADDADRVSIVKAERNVGLKNDAFPFSSSPPSSVLLDEQRRSCQTRQHMRHARGPHSFSLSI